MIQLSREKQVGVLVRYAMWPCTVLVGGLLGWSIDLQREPVSIHVALLALWLVLAGPIDVFLYAKARWPERKQIGNFPLSGLIAILAVGKDR